MYVPTLLEVTSHYPYTPDLLRELDRTEVRSPLLQLLNERKARREESNEMEVILEYEGVTLGSGISNITSDSKVDVALRLTDFHAPELLRELHDLLSTMSPVQLSHLIGASHEVDEWFVLDLKSGRHGVDFYFSSVFSGIERVLFELFHFNTKPFIQYYAENPDMFESEERSISNFLREIMTEDNELKIASTASKYNKNRMPRLDIMIAAKFGSERLIASLDYKWFHAAMYLLMYALDESKVRFKFVVNTLVRQEIYKDCWSIYKEVVEFVPHVLGDYDTRTMLNLIEETCELDVNYLRYKDHQRYGRVTYHDILDRLFPVNV